MRDRLSSLALPQSLREAIEYALLAGGKRLRPRLVVESCCAVGGRAGDAGSAALAVELVHAFSLVHDDLPAMDDDDLRRGRPTLHVAKGEAMAVLAGDAMLTLAFSVLAGDYEGDLSRRLAQELAAGTVGMIAGQAYDTLGGVPVAEGIEKVKLIHHHKTGALFRAACRMGGLVGGASERDLDALTGFGEAVGLAFQIADDLLDVERSPEETGKRTGKDEEAGKSTYPGVVGAEASRAEIERLRREAVGAISAFGVSAEPLAELCGLMAERTR